jgi:hypothetical protein
MVSGESPTQQQARLKRTIRALPPEDRSWLLYYLTGYQPDAVDRAVAALSGQLSKEPAAPAPAPPAPAPPAPA